MKKILLTLLLFSVAVSSYAGDNKNKKGDYPKVRFGAEGGLNLANIIFQGQYAVQSDYTLTWNAGVYSNILFNDNLTFQPELLYNVNGATYPNIATSHLNYIEIPLLVKYNTSKSFAIFGGPYMGYFINGSSGGTTIVSSNSSSSNEGFSNRLDMGIDVGVEYQWLNGLNIGLKYVREFCTFESAAPGYIIGYTEVFSLYAGWTFK